jgi:hypothetical protein
MMTQAPPWAGSAVDPAGQGAVTVATQTSGLAFGSCAIEPAGQGGGGGAGAQTAPWRSTLASPRTTRKSG